MTETYIIGFDEVQHSSEVETTRWKRELLDSLCLMMTDINSQVTV
jgi:hypothetical protein